MADAVTEFGFEATIIEWRGPSPFFFVPVPEAEAEEIRRLARAVTYGWGMIPVEATIFGVKFKTSMFARDETYFLPLKAAVRKKTGVTAGDVVAVEMVVGGAAR